MKGLDWKCALEKEKVFQSWISESGWAALMLPLFGWLMTAEWNLCVLWKDFITKTERSFTSVHRNKTKRVQSWQWRVQLSWNEIRVEYRSTPRHDGLWCECEKPLRPVPLQGRTMGDMACPLYGPAASLRCHLHTNVTNPSGMTHLHTMPRIPILPCLQMSEDLGLGTTTGKEGDCVDSTGHSFSLHHFTLTSPHTLLCPPSFIFFQAPGLLCSFCDYGTFTRVLPRHTPHATLQSVATLPPARRLRF